MAELAIPLIGLASAYLLSNQKRSDGNPKPLAASSAAAAPVKEGYVNMGRPVNAIPNVAVPPDNYPVFKPKTGYDANEYSNFPSPNAATDKYYEQSVFENVANGGPDFGGKTQFGDTYQQRRQVMSLTGKPMDAADFKHNNMAPFFGAKIRGRTTDANVHESVLDTMNGAGSQWVSKTEVAPLFKPQENYNYVYGTPNTSDFMQSRQMPSSNMANVKPWEEVHVAPGLDKGFTDIGSGGFNSGMDARDKWVDRNVDELRVKTNPKLTFGLETHEGPAYYYIQNAPTAATQGKVEKYLPDTYYLNTPDRWLTTTGLEKAQTARAIQADRFVNRPSTTAEYFGAGAEQNGAATYAAPAVEPSKRQQVDPTKHHAINMAASDQRPASVADHGRLGFKVLHNNRSTTANAVPMGGVFGAIRAVVAPLLEVVRPSRKENVIGNLRAYANAGSTVPAGTVFNPADRLPTTIKETTSGLLDFNHLNFERQTNAGYQVADQQPVENQRDTTTDVEYMGSAGGAGAHMGNQVYNAAYNQHNNNNKVQTSWTNQGNMSLLSHDANVSVRKQNVSTSNYMGAAAPGPNTVNMPPSVETYGKARMPQNYPRNAIECERINPDILDAFRNNPYTQSLHSYCCR
jgi:hypothetical protein